MDRWREVLAVAAGGALGALGRYGVGVAAVAVGIDSPWATLAVNVVGCLLMGLLVAAVLEDPRRTRHALWRPFLGVGVLGGFTTFSAFAGDAVLLAEAGHGVISASYVVVTVVAGLAALRLGIFLARSRSADAGAR